MTNSVSPRPWKIVWGDADLAEPRTVWSIIDADGGVVIETDMGVYGPCAEDAELIIAAVNSYTDGG